MSKSKPVSQSSAELRRRVWHAPPSKLKTVSELVGFSPHNLCVCTRHLRVRMQQKIFPLSLLVRSWPSIRKSRPVQMQPRVGAWVCMHVDKGELLVCLWLPGRGLRLGIPLQPPESPGWWRWRWEASESLTFPSYSYIQRGPVFLCWCLVKSWPRFYFYLLFQVSKMMFPVSFQCKGTLLVRLKPDLCHVGYQCFLSPMNAFEAPFINSVLTLLWKWIEMMDLRSYLLKVKL